MKHIEQVGGGHQKIAGGAEVHPQAAGPRNRSEANEFHVLRCLQDIHRHAGLWCVMACQHARADWCLAVFRHWALIQLEVGSDERRVDVIAGNAAGTQDSCRFPTAVNNGGLDTTVTAPPIEDDIDAARKPLQNMICTCGAYGPRRVGAWRGDRPPEGLQQLLRCGFRRHTKGDPVEAGACQTCYGAVFPAVKNKGHWPRPKSGRKPFCDRCRTAQRKCRLGAGNMADQRVEGGALFCGKNTGNRIRVARIGPKAVDGFRREGDKTTVPKGGCGHFQIALGYRETRGLSVPLGL